MSPVVSIQRLPQSVINANTVPDRNGKVAKMSVELSPDDVILGTHEEIVCFICILNVVCISFFLRVLRIELK